MRRSHTTVLTLFATGALLLGACSSDDAGDTAASTDDAVELGEPVVLDATWETFGYDLANSRFNPDEVVLDANNADTLDVLWQNEIGTGVTSTPAVADGTVYFGDWTGALIAADAVDGTERWKTPLEHGQVMSSPTLHGDAVVVATSRGLHLVDRDDGEVRWSVETSDHRIAITPASPVVADDLVLIGVASGELMVPLEDGYSFRGSVAAFDLASGEQVWQRWFTAGDDIEGAGVGIWSNPSIDLERRHVYVGAGNTYEPPQAPLSNSVVALDLDSGDVVWSTQFTAPDVWSMAHPGGLDADVGAGPNLFSADGRDLVGAGDKRGDYYALDRDSGEIVWSADVSEGSLLGGVIGTSATDGERIYVASNVGDPENNAPTNRAVVVALDVVDGSVVWEHELGGAVFAPVTATPGLVYVATTAATYHVLDATAGDELWSMEIPDQGGSGASVVNGVVYWGYGYSLFGSGAQLGGLYALAPGGTATSSEEQAAASSDHPGTDVFRSRCASCHGMDGQGGTGPRLAGVTERLSVEEQVLIVRNGKGVLMPAFASTLDDAEIDAVVDYTRTQLAP